MIASHKIKRLAGRVVGFIFLVSELLPADTTYRESKFMSYLLYRTCRKLDSEVFITQHLKHMTVTLFVMGRCCPLIQTTDF
jgi:hypothetical protein